MSTTNENILKSLSSLEQNLKAISNAKEQVNIVVKSSIDLAKVIESYQTTFESLSINVKSVLDDSRKFNNDSIKTLSAHTTSFSNEIAKLSEFDVHESLKSIEDESIKYFQENLNRPLKDLDEQIQNIEKEVNKLTQYDFKESFNNLEKEVISQFDIDLKDKLILLDEKTQNLQFTINEFKDQIDRIEKIDLTLLIKGVDNNIKGIQSSIVSVKNSFETVLRENQMEITSVLKSQNEEMETLKSTINIIIGISVICLIINSLSLLF
jgi:hypothetical protein